MRNVFDYFDELDDEQKVLAREVGEKYGDNRWWESDDPLVVIGNQIREPFFMMSFSEYQSALETLLGRSVPHIGYAFGKSRIAFQVENALKLKRLVGGVDTELVGEHGPAAKQIDYAKRLFPKRE